MPKVLIVGKTRMGSGICLGGIVLTSCRSVRLMPRTGYTHAKSTPFKLGEIWNLELQEVPKRELTAPHNEDVRVIRKSKVKTLSSRKLKNRILRIFDVPLIYPKQLFDSSIRFTAQRKALVYLYGRRPRRSTGFWRLNKALHKRFDADGKVRYLYCEDDSGCAFSDQDLVLDVPYVGCDAPIETIPRDTLLRFSLSREYRAGKYIGFWLQLSGWFL